mmetsp:Transcript_15829/g.34249  ORF Transcript_15829/g.34249 Transcript_15829/m.34249 type:complete len:211 (-) Transcript_15829:124-756(-)|eukprot:CAMPEP_0185851754 /NCGR_PEP_ID=MMETSP1354-20130828/11442_1 /TAXON_ID=708628 /ORGANISM="Erythrolobus madagascarensis, Strain CCMP3276" /LENGTH=210 /DNA_ID=CAMNT_0028552811 /DNA_START=83 /DNA_END=715 /DNA_ORIENTATION=-
MNSDYASPYDNQFKILMVGNSGVGKSSLLLRFTDDVFDDLQPTIGVDFKVKSVRVENKYVKLTVWDTAGQERFRTLTSAYYRGAHGVIFVYDVTRKETFDDLRSVWLREAEQFTTNHDFVRMVVANKLDLEADRVVSRADGEQFARDVKSLYAESSAKTCAGVQFAFEELISRILETPSLCDAAAGRSGPGGAGGIALSQQDADDDSCAC